MILTHRFPISLAKFILISLLITGKTSRLRRLLRRLTRFSKNNFIFLEIAADPPDQMKTVCDLRKKLLGTDTDRKYDKLSKPTKDHTTKIELVMMIHLFQIVDLVRLLRRFQLQNCFKFFPTISIVEHRSSKGQSAYNVLLGRRASGLECFRLRRIG